METNYSTTFSLLINSYSPVTPFMIEKMMESGNLQEYKKNEIVFAEKKFNAFEYFQLEGISHRYNIDADNQVITTGIYNGPQVITPHFARNIISQNII